MGFVLVFSFFELKEGNEVDDIGLIGFFVV